MLLKSSKFLLGAFKSKPVGQVARVLHDLDGVCGTNLTDQLNIKGTPVLNDLGLPDYRLPHRIWTADELRKIKITHLSPKNILDAMAYCSVEFLRFTYDIVSGYAFGYKTERSLTNRVLILETVAAIPGFTGAFLRHLQSCRRMAPDYGWIHTLLEEAENERMHLMTALMLKDPSFIVKTLVRIAQLGFVAFYATAYTLSPYYCHRFVGYLEEEAVKTYTGIIDYIDAGKLPGFEVLAPAAAAVYWKLGKDATLRDVWLAIRADESHHREVNHEFADMIKTNTTQLNPFAPGY